MNYYIGIIFIIILILLFIINTNNEDIINDETYIAQYNIKNRNNKRDKIKNHDNIFNIKEFETINENIIIHNKFKNELLENKLKILTQKNKEDIERENYINKLNKQIETNSEFLKRQEIETNILKKFNEIESIKQNFKIDINNILNDIKNNKLDKFEKNNLIKNLSNILNKLHKELNIYNQLNDQNNSNLTSKYIKLLNYEIDLISKKLKIYSQILK